MYVLILGFSDLRLFFLTLKMTQVCIVAKVTSDYRLMVVEEMVTRGDNQPLDTTATNCNHSVTCVRVVLM